MGECSPGREVRPGKVFVRLKDSSTCWIDAAACKFMDF
jgi:hypothetical protein